MNTPVVQVDMDRVEQNVRRFQAYLAEHGIKNRPHVKTHKLPQIAQLQVEAGAVGVTCQKLGEAEVMVDAGITDIFIPYNILGEEKLERLMQLCKKATISVTADSAVTIRGLSEAAAAAGQVLPVLVEFEAGLQRCGVTSPQEAAELAVLIHELPGLRFGGWMCYPYDDQTTTFINEANSIIATDGLVADVVSVGGTPKLYAAHLVKGLTEYRAGMYVFGDEYTVITGDMTLEQCALHVIATVVSRPTETRAVIDAGNKTISSDCYESGQHGMILEYPEAKLNNLSEEHGVIDLTECTKRPEIGEQITILPNHCCSVINLANEVSVMRGGRAVDVWSVAARGKVQ